MVIVLEVVIIWFSCLCVKEEKEIVVGSIRSQ